jgi:hypothetical protein
MSKAEKRCLFCNKKLHVSDGVIPTLPRADVNMESPPKHRVYSCTRPKCRTDAELNVKEWEIIMEKKRFVAQKRMRANPIHKEIYSTVERFRALQGEQSKPC